MLPRLLIEAIYSRAIAAPKLNFSQPNHPDIICGEASLYETFHKETED
jgi:hypothetical protein